MGCEGMISAAKFSGGNIFVAFTDSVTRYGKFCILDQSLNMVKPITTFFDESETGDISTAAFNDDRVIVTSENIEGWNINDFFIYDFSGKQIASGSFTLDNEFRVFTPIDSGNKAVVFHRVLTIIDENNYTFSYAVSTVDSSGTQSSDQAVALTATYGNSKADCVEEFGNGNILFLFWTADNDGSTVEKYSIIDPSLNQLTGFPQAIEPQGDHHSYAVKRLSDSGNIMVVYNSYDLQGRYFIIDSSGATVQSPVDYGCGMDEPQIRALSGGEYAIIGLDPGSRYGEIRVISP